MKHPRTRMKNPALVLLLSLVAVTIAAVITAIPATAQEGIPDGAECIRFDLDPTLDVFVPGDRDLVLLMLEDGSQIFFPEVIDNQRLESPNGSPIVIMYKCQLPDTHANPEPTPHPTVEPTPEPTVEPTPEPTVEPTPEPTVEPTPEPTVEPTPEPTVEPTPEATVEPTPEPTTEAAAPPATSQAAPTPEVEVLGAVQERDGELALTGVDSALLTYIALALIAVGLGLRRLRPNAS